jgi:hypothetical protein
MMFYALSNCLMSVLLLLLPLEVVTAAAAG